MRQKLLCVLAQSPKGMAGLARTFGVEKAALTGLVDRVERRGLATRSPVPGDRRALCVNLTDTGDRRALCVNLTDTGDRRALCVNLTDTGGRAAAAFHTDATAELDQLLSPLTPHQRKNLRASIAKILDSQPGTP